MGAETKTKPQVETCAVPIEKAKIFIVGRVGGIACVFIPIRSEFEETRQGKPDLPGGKRMPPPPKGSKILRETAEEGLLRDSGEEFPGVIIEKPTLIDIVEKVKDDVPVITRIYAGIGKGDFYPGLNEHGEYEHTDEGGWVPITQISKIGDLPNKYRRAAASDSGRLALACLAELAYDMPIDQEDAEFEMLAA